MASSPEKETTLRHTRTWNPRADAVQDPLFQEHPDFFDARDLVQVKYEMLRRVRQDGNTVTHASATFGFSRPAFYQAQASWETAGLAGLVPARPGPHGPSKLSDTILRAAEAAQVAHPDWSYAQLVQWVGDEYAITIHPRTLARALTRGRNRS